MERISFEKEGKMKEFLKNLDNAFKALTKFQFIRFCVTGSLGVVTDLIISYIVLLVLKSSFTINLDSNTNGLTDKILLCIPPVLGFVAAVIQNYLINHCWTFGKETENHRVSFKLFGKFFGVALFALIPRLIVYVILINNVLNPNSFFNLANFGGIMAGMFFNFFGSKFFVFRFKEAVEQQVRKQIETVETAVNSKEEN